MKTKVVAFVVIMISLCSCLFFSGNSTAENFFKAFAAMYAPAKSNERSSNVMFFDGDANPAVDNVPSNKLADANLGLEQKNLLR